MDDWSATYVRTRAEMFIAACFIAAIAAFHFDLANVPFLGFKLLAPPPRWLVITILDAFFVYVTFSFWIRRQVETTRRINPHVEIDKLIGEIRSLQTSLSALDLLPQVAAFSDEVTRLLGVAEELKQLTEAQLAATTTRALSALGARVKRLGPKDLTTKETKEFIESFIGRGEVVSKAEVPVQFESLLQQAWSKQIGSIDATLEPVKRFSEDAAATRRHTHERINAVSQLATDIDAGLRGALGSQADSVEAAIVRTEASLDVLSKQLRSWRNADGIDRNVIGFIAPLVASLCLAVGGTVYFVWQEVTRPLPWYEAGKSILPWLGN